jgi:hypothetical protein
MRTNPRPRLRAAPTRARTTGEPWPGDCRSEGLLQHAIFRLIARDAAGT